MKKIKRIPQLDGQLGWFETSPNKDQPFPPVKAEGQRYDYVVVGGGFTGLGVCARLAELNPDARIALVDALKIGQGTSGRNAGFIIDLPHNLDSDEPDQVADGWVYKFNCQAIELLDSRRQQFGVDCQWHRAGKYLAAHESRHLGNLDNFIRTLQGLDSGYQYLTSTELSKRLGTHYYQAAVYTPGNVLMNPAALSRGIALGLAQPEAGRAQLEVFEQQPITAIEYGKQTLLQLAGGQISADKLVLATNSFTEEFGLVSSRLAPVFTYASLTEPLSDAQLATLGNIEPWGLTSAHPAGTTVRLTQDKRIFIRNGFDFDPKLATNTNKLEKAMRKHRRSFEKRFPQLAGVAFEYSWGGMLCITRNFQSLFGEQRENVFIVAGMNGVGVAKGTYMGHYMAEMISGVDSPELEYLKSISSPNWIPPDPLRSVGVRTRLMLEEKLARGEN